MRALTLAAVAGGAAFGYASVIERNWFALRRSEIPVLPPDAEPVRVLHISDIHLTPGRHRLLSWIRSLDALAPDLVVNTGDTISAADAIPAIMHSLEPLTAFPATFVPGNNDYYGPRMRSPHKYFTPRDLNERHGAPLPWPQPLWRP